MSGCLELLKSHIQERVSDAQTNPLRWNTLLASLLPFVGSRALELPTFQTWLKALLQLLQSAAPYMPLSASIRNLLAAVCCFSFRLLFFFFRFCCLLFWGLGLFVPQDNTIHSNPFYSNLIQYEFNPFQSIPFQSILFQSTPIHSIPIQIQYKYKSNSNSQEEEETAHLRPMRTQTN